MSIYLKSIQMSSKAIPEQHQKRLEYLSTYFRELRFNEGMTQVELSQETNLHRNSIIRAENAKNMTLISIFEMADFFDLSISELFQDIK